MTTVVGTHTVMFFGHVSFYFLTVDLGMELQLESSMDATLADSMYSQAIT